MTISELIASASDKSTEGVVKEFERRVAEREKQFSEETRRQVIDDEFLARSYNL
jgi:hypothetical protein